jgi:transcription elongation factor SPT5
MLYTAKLTFDSPATVGCVVKVDRESMRVLDQNGSIRQMLPSQVTNKIEQRKDAIATDRNGSEIRYGDIIREVGGESKSGVILHIHRAFVFVHNRTQPENAGIFVARCVGVTTIAAKGGRATAADAKTNSAMKNGDGTNAPMAPPRSMGRDRLIGKTVTIRKGPYKGILGIVRNATETTARIEMHSKAKIISVNRDEVTVKEYVLHSLFFSP